MLAAVAARSRLDQALVQRGLVESRSIAKRVILAGRVQVDGHTADKPGIPVGEDSEITLATPPPFVSRGGEKLSAALAASGIDVRDAICIDIGASTGGFTDCLLQAGAAQVVAVDVGYGQLDWRLRQEPRVHVLERTNARHLTPEDLPVGVAPRILVMDASFIGVLKLLPAISAVCAEQAEALVLVKPQFEAGPELVERGGVVRRTSVRRQTLIDVARGAENLGWQVVAAYPSPLRGPAGNWECFLQLRRPGVAPCGGDPIEALDIPDDSTGGAS